MDYLHTNLNFPLEKLYGDCEDQILQPSVEPARLAGCLVRKMGKNYYDLHITSSHSFGTNSIEEMVKMAERLGLHTIAVVDSLENEKELEEIKGEIAFMSKKTAVQILLGVELRAEDAASLAEKINRWRNLVDILAVAGGSLEINRAACENPKVDFLAHPEYKRKDPGLDHVMIQAAAKNFVAIELNFREYLHTYKKLRSHVLAHMTQNVSLAQQFGAPVIVTSAAESIWDMRAGRELASLAYLAGLDREKAVAAVTTVAEQIVAKVRQVKEPGYVMPGVKVVE